MSHLPEFTNPPDLYYNEKESQNYHRNSRVVKIQSEITTRALELLEITEDHPFILDIGCGSGLSGKVMSERGISWVGMDLSPSMLQIASSSVESTGYIQADIGVKLPFQEESFDYAISISTVQWLFHSFETAHNPILRLRTFFKSIHRCVKKKIAIQFYCSKKEIEILKAEAHRAGFFGGFIIDNEGTKNCKNYLVLSKDKPVVEKKNDIKVKKSSTKRARIE